VNSSLCGTTVSVIVSMQFKNIKALLCSQIVCNVLGCLSLLFAGGISGGAVYMAAILQAVIYFIFRIKEKEPPMWLAYVFFALFIACSVTTYQKPQDIIACVAALTCAVSLVQKKPSMYRLIMLTNGILWSFYDMSVGAWTMIISHLITSASAMVGMIRLDFKKNKEGKNEN